MRRYSISMGYGSECLTLPFGDFKFVRLEPCYVGDIRSASKMYSETEVQVDTDYSDWYIAGYNYETYVDRNIYYNVILFNTSFYRKNNYTYGEKLYPSWGRPSAFRVVSVGNRFGHRYINNYNWHAGFSRR
ncbi:hypothetical protein P3G55_14155 [Leptospira sp. 96542]|nr:hypothetical protein [Leptospira sp. 96542]